MNPDNPHWHSDIEAAHKVKSANDINWNAQSDIVIIGVGGAGVSCALQALELGQSVIAIDRFNTGGATRASGGVIYAGGGTRLQKEAGISDSPENMFNYLEMEVGDIVSKDTLRQFCNESASTIDWMEKHGVDLRSSLWPHKTSYPAPQYFLYHSDNTLVSPYKEKATPAARGHRGYVPIEQGRKATNLGNSLFDPLRDAALKIGMELQTYTEARQLIVDNKGAVIGVKTYSFSDEKTKEAYLGLRQKAQRLLAMFPPIIPGSKFFMKRALKLFAQAKALEKDREVKYIRAHKAVLLSAGGFIFNRAMVEHYASKYKRAFPLGTDGDSGAGIRLGQTAGGAVGNMDRITAWRFINPPLSFAKGMIVNLAGKRFINEMVYGATLGVETVENHKGEAWLILDKPTVKQALEDVSGDKALAFQKALAKLNIYFGAKKASDLKSLAQKIGVDPENLVKQGAEYNYYASDDASDPFGKSSDDVVPLKTAPYFGINIGLSAKLYPCPTLTLGGLTIDEASGQVADANGKAVKGLYAAGRNAIGIASWNYVSGLSIADGVFSGRRAARAIAKL